MLVAQKTGRREIFGPAGMAVFPGVRFQKRLPPLILVGITVALFGVVGQAFAEAVVAEVLPPLAEAPEYNTKAGYLLTMTRYVEWPPVAFADATEPLVIGVLGANPFGDVLERTVHGLRSQGRPIMVRYVKTVEAAVRCQVVFIARLPENNVADWLRTLRGKPVLTITESEQGIAEGAVLTFVMEKSSAGTKVRFDASMANASEAGLQLSALMLKSAKKVYRLPEPAKGHS